MEEQSRVIQLMSQLKKRGWDGIVHHVSEEAASCCLARVDLRCVDLRCVCVCVRARGAQAGAREDKLGAAGSGCEYRVRMKILTR